MTPTSPGAPHRLVMGLGSPFRGDDGVGPLVVQEVSRRLAGRDEGIRIVERGEPSDLLHLLDGIELAVLVDAVRTGRNAGSIVVLEGGTDTSPAPARQEAGLGGTHALGLASVIELARVLERLPRRLVVVGIEASQFEPGTEPSSAVHASIAPCADIVTRLVSTATAANGRDAT